MEQSYFLIGNFKVYFYGLLIFLGSLAAYLYNQKRLKNHKICDEDYDELYLLLIVFSIIGARIYHVLSDWSYYSQNPQKIIAVWEGGLGIFGAIIAGIIFISIFARVKKIKFMVLLDLIMPSILLTYAIGRIGNYFNLEIFGFPTNLPWKLYVPFEKRPPIFAEFSYFHPVFLYESILSFIAFILFTRFERKLKPGSGAATGYYFFSFGLFRFLTEFLRFDTWVLFNLKVSQLLSFFFILLGLYLIQRGIKKKKLVK